ncbi:unnamed protein product [Macrosiphum euphorbiae]|uniref:Reverse transcriptase domain-containing protein n=1 Tax=Macrosiphum euphorbiae TaxID=13131 RepID=A0AAV0Y0T3_9HEMI|nr:unnamed protein product [Macrosiphum euphorbiae]
MFADDIKLFHRISTPQDCILLQDDLNSLVTWAATHGLDLCIPKCSLMAFYRSLSCPISFNYSISGVLLEFAEFLWTSSLKVLFCSFVRSKLEYGAVIWCQATMSDSYQLERIQRKFLKCASFTSSIDCPPHDYNPVLCHLVLTTLADRRVQTNLSVLAKLINGQIDSPVLLNKLNFRIKVFNSRSVFKFHIPFCSVNYLRNCPMSRMMRLANEVPSFLLGD